MAKHEARRLILSSYYHVVRRALARKPSAYYGRKELYSKIWSNAASDIGAEIHSAENDYFRIVKNDRFTTVQFHYVNIDTYFNMMLVSQKPLVCRMLKELGYPIPRYREFDPYTFDKAKTFLSEIGNSTVVKPRQGSGGGGVTTGIDTESRLRKASSVAASSWSRKMMIEEQCEGESFRLLFLDGELIDAIKRCRPTVVGDGKRSIKELIEAENVDRTSSTSCRALVGLNIDLDCKYWLQDNGMTLASVPNAGERTIVKNVANENSIDDNFSVREIVHSDYKKMGKLLSSSLGVKLIGLDLMSTDISLPLELRQCVVNEINIPPGLHYHELINNSERTANVSARILEFALMNPGIPMSRPISELAKCS
jgi:D-alanine-D-alanine ligase-like ATP-grasp enzyme